MTSETASQRQWQGRAPLLAFVGSRTTRERNARGAGLSVYAVDAADGPWRLLQTVELINPSYLCVSAATRCLYADFNDRGRPFQADRGRRIRRRRWRAGEAREV